MVWTLFCLFVGALIGATATIGILLIAGAATEPQEFLFEKPREPQSW